MFVGMWFKPMPSTRLYRRLSATESRNLDLPVGEANGRKDGVFNADYISGFLDKSSSMSDLSELFASNIEG
jgi:hypothetical protein